MLAHALASPAWIDVQPPPIFFDTASELIKPVVAAPVMYAAVILLIRLSGKRTTSQMNNFDWIVTVAMGSMIASPILIEKVTLAEATLGVASLLLLQFTVTRLSTRSEAFERLVKASPTLLAYNGRLLHGAMRRERVTRNEIMAALREGGLTRVDQVGAVVLESDASMSVLPRSAQHPDESLSELGAEATENEP